MTDPSDWAWNDVQQQQQQWQPQSQQISNTHRHSNTMVTNGVSAWDSSPYVVSDMHQTTPYNPYARGSGASQPQNNYYGQQQQANTFGIGDPNAYFNNLADSLPPQMLLADPVVNAARTYGGQLAQEQTERISRYLSTYKLKYYFAVDSAYVGKKIGLLLFPFIHRDWAVRYQNSSEPMPARFDINAPDLYIPLMTIVTYLLVSGFVLGTQGRYVCSFELMQHTFRFTPEQLGLLTSNALAWLVIENFILLVTKYMMNISQSLSFCHTLAFSGYKFVGMIISLVAFLIGGRTAYLCALAYTSMALSFFLVRTVKSYVLDAPGGVYYDGGTKRKLYLLLFISFTQPFIIWWLTSNVANVNIVLSNNIDA